MILEGAVKETSVTILFLYESHWNCNLSRGHRKKIIQEAHGGKSANDRRHDKSQVDSIMLSKMLKVFRCLCFLQYKDNEETCENTMWAS